VILLVRTFDGLRFVLGDAAGLLADDVPEGIHFSKYASIVVMWKNVFVYNASLFTFTYEYFKWHP
jgi:hypothetical protein